MPTVTLRAQTAADADVLYRIASDLDSWEERGPDRPAPLTREAWDARNSAGQGLSGTVAFVIDADGLPVGSVSLFSFDELARNAEVGIALLTEARGQGIGTAALRQIVEFGFARCNLHRVHLEVIASNAAAIRSYQKAGFVIEGRQREQAWVRGGYEDIVRMGLLRSDPRP